VTLAANARYYTELAGLGELRRQARRGSEDARAGVAREFEAMFVQMMIAQMREATPATEDELLGAGGSMYRDLLDKQLALEMSEAGGLGLASQIMAALPAPGESRGPEGEETASRELRMPVVPDAASRARSAREALDEVQRSLERMLPDPFNAGLSPDPRSGAAGGSVAPPAPGRPVASGGFDSPEHFVHSLRGAAARAAAEIGAAPDVLLAQAALETGWGRHLMQGADGRASFNLFGIKADARWQGPTVEVLTTEYRHGHAVRERARFRAYASFDESFRDYANFLKTNPRYVRALAVSDQPHRFMQALQHAGYATDPHYASKVTAVMRAEAFEAARASGIPSS
jgi:flagellar protein FlgJ